MVLLLPPAPAALVLDGRAFATLSALSAAAFLLIAVAGPPGGFGDEGRAVVVPVDGGELTGEVGLGEDCDEVSLGFCPVEMSDNAAVQHWPSTHGSCASRACWVVSVVLPSFLLDEFDARLTLQDPVCTLCQVNAIENVWLSGQYGT